MERYYRKNSVDCFKAGIHLEKTLFFLLVIDLNFLMHSFKSLK